MRNIKPSSLEYSPDFCILSSVSHSPLLSDSLRTILSRTCVTFTLKLAWAINEHKNHDQVCVTMNMIKLGMQARCEDLVMACLTSSTSFRAHSLQSFKQGHLKPLPLWPSSRVLLVSLIVNMALLRFCLLLAQPLQSHP